MMYTDDVIERFWSKVDIRGEDECWPWIGAIKTGYVCYGSFWLNGKMEQSNRVAWKIHNDMEIPDGLVIRHKCNFGRCCNFRHLITGTSKDNANDTIVAGRWRPSTGGSKLNEDQVREILALGDKGFPTWQIALRYNVKAAAIRRIINRETWQHVILER